jgi:hypothetical protein
VLTQLNEGGRCKCGGCGRTFSGLTMFDAHFTTLDTPPWSQCNDPATVTKKDGTPLFRLEGDIWKSSAVNDRWQS